MNKAMVGTVTAALAMCLSAAAFAGNGQGGTGGGNAHGAATSGMTHWGDPVVAPGGPMARSIAAKNMDGTPAMVPMMRDGSRDTMQKPQ